MINKIKTLIEQFDFSDLGYNELLACNRIDEIKNYLGDIVGYSYSDFISNSLVDSTYHITENQTAYNNKVYDSMLRDFFIDNNIKEVDFDNYPDPYLDLLIEYEQDYDYPAFLSLCIEQEYKHNIIITLNINYKDSPYYARGAENIKHIELKPYDFYKLTYNGLIALLKE